MPCLCKGHHEERQVSIYKIKRLAIDRAFRRTAIYHSSASKHNIYISRNDTAYLIIYPIHSAQKQICSIELLKQKL